MNKSRFIYVLLCLLVLGAGIFVYIKSAKKNDTLTPEKVNPLWEQQIVLVYNQILVLESPKSVAEKATSLQTYATGLEALIPQVEKVFKDYTAYMEKNKKANKPEPQPTESSASNETENTTALSPEEKAQDDAILKLAATSLFTTNFIQIQSNKFNSVPEAKQALEKLDQIKSKLALPETLSKRKEVALTLNNLVMGQMSGSAQVEPFFKRMSRAAMTSRFKISMQRMYVLGLAINQFINDFKYAPKVTDLDQLNNYAEFVPKYIKAIPREDGWGNYFYYKADGPNYWIGSAGTDSQFNGFDQTGIYTELEKKNIIFSNGKFTHTYDLNANAQTNN